MVGHLVDHGKYLLAVAWQVRTMKANYEIEAGDVRVIRPLCYAREAFTKEFARANHLPVVNENCPACFEEPKERHRVKKVTAAKLAHAESGPMALSSGQVQRLGEKWH